MAGHRVPMTLAESTDLVHCGRQRRHCELYVRRQPREAPRAPQQRQRLPVLRCRAAAQQAAPSRPHALERCHCDEAPGGPVAAACCAATEQRTGCRQDPQAQPPSGHVWGFGVPVFACRLALSAPKGREAMFRTCSKLGSSRTSAIAALHGPTDHASSEAANSCPLCSVLCGASLSQRLPLCMPITPMVRCCNRALCLTNLQLMAAEPCSYDRLALPSQSVCGTNVCLWQPIDAICCRSNHMWHDYTSAASGVTCRMFQRHSQPQLR